MAVLAKDPSTNVLADEILRIIEHSAHYDTESLPYFRMMMRLRERRQDRAPFPLASRRHPKRERMVGSAAPEIFAAALSLGATVALGQEIGIRHSNV